MHFSSCLKIISNYLNYINQNIIICVSETQYFLGEKHNNRSECQTPIKANSCNYLISALC